MSQFIPINLNIQIKNAINALPESEREKQAPKVRRAMIAEYNREQRASTKSEMAKKRRKWLFQEETAKLFKSACERAITQTVEAQNLEQGDDLREVIEVFENKLLQAVNKFIRR